MKKYLPVFLLTAIGIRCVVAVAATYMFRQTANFDINSYIYVGLKTLFVEGVPKKILLGNHPYFPLMMFVEAAVMWVSLALKVRPDLLFRLLFSLTDTLILIPLYLLKRKKMVLFLYAVNPVSILISSFHGQFDSMPLFLLLMSLYFLGQKKSFLFYLCANFAIAIKTWPLLFLLPVLIKAGKRAQLLLLGIVPALLTAIYWATYRTSPLAVLMSVAVYRGYNAFFGVGILTGLLPQNKYINLALSTSFIIALVVLSLKSNIKNAIRQTLYSLLLFFILTPTFANQWLMWLIPFLLMEKTAKTKVPFIVLSLYLAVSYLVPQSDALVRLLAQILSILAWLLLTRLFVQLFGRPAPAARDESQ